LLIEVQFAQGWQRTGPESNPRPIKQGCKPDALTAMPSSHTANNTNAKLRNKPQKRLYMILYSDQCRCIALVRQKQYRRKPSAYIVQPDVL